MQSLKVWLAARPDRESDCAIETRMEPRRAAPTLDLCVYSLTCGHIAAVLCTQVLTLGLYVCAFGAVRVISMVPVCK